MYISRHIYKYIQKMTEQFKVVLITGSRQVGKSTLVNKEFSNKYECVVLDDFNELSLAKNDMSLFFKNHPFPVFIDEVQRVPELFLQIKYLVDKSENKGDVVLSGSQSYHLLNSACESLAGRVCIINMTAFSMREIKKIEFYEPFIPSEKYITQRIKTLKSYDNIWQRIQNGNMPELVSNNVDCESFFRSYVNTYIERDVRELINIKNVLKFTNFIKCLAARTGELYNADSIARDVGITTKTAQEWISVLECSGIIKIIHPYSTNVTNRAIKTPKIYFMDTGLVCYLVGWSNPEVAKNGAMSGTLFETFIVSEIIKSFYNSGHGTGNIYFYRDKDKKEIDLVIEKDNILYPIEVKKTATPTKDMAKNFKVLNNITGKTVASGVILCQCEKKMYLADNLIALPIEFL